MRFLSTKLSNMVAPHNLIRVRRRYMFARSGLPRLRYVGLVVVSVGLFFALQTPSGYSHTVIASQSEAAMASAEKYAADVVTEEDKTIAAALQSRISQGIREASLAIKKPQRPPYREVEIGKGDTIAGILQKAGASNAESFKIVTALSEYFDPRQARPGQKLRVHFTGGSVSQTGTEEAAEPAPRVNGITMSVDPTKTIHVKRAEDDDFAADLETKDIVVSSYANEMSIQTSLYGSALRAGIPASIIAEVIRAYSWDVDFQRDIRRGDTLQVLYEVHETEDGEFIRYGDVKFADLAVGGDSNPIYRFEMDDGRVDYFEEDGHSIKKALMSTPVEGARVSSGYGMRKHPILGYNKMHKGVDFAAPTGTPIFASGDGVIEKAGRWGAYGNYIRIRHNSTLKTAYAHLHKYAKGMTSGKRVEQGDIIGYVGSTGRSTGPHLHYEVIVNGEQVNPRSVDLPVGEQLAGAQYKRFKKIRDGLKEQYVSLTRNLRFAQNQAGEQETSALR